MPVVSKKFAIRTMAKTPIYRALPPGVLRTYAALRYHEEQSGHEDIVRFVQSLGTIPTKYASTALVAARAAFRVGQDDVVSEALAALERRFPDRPDVFLFKAEFERFYGRFDDAMASADRARLLRPSNAQATARVVELAPYVYDRERADEVAIAAVRRFPRNAGVLWAAARTCESPEQYHRIYAMWRERAVDVEQLIDAVRPLASAASRTGLVEEALELYRQAIRLIHSSARPPQALNETRLGGRGAWGAIKDLRQAFDDAGLPFFFAAGTALGLVREGRPLSADADIDVGVDESRWDRDALIEMFTRNPRFELDLHPLTTRVSLRHRGGSPIDVFRFYRDGEKVWHNGVFVRWGNTPFEVTRRTFNGVDLPIPADPDRYLTENYGDWRTPNSAFDAFVDEAEGLDVTWPEYQRLHIVRRAFRQMMVREIAATQRELRLAGEDELANTIGRKHG